jgi:predicted nucleotidyltransferase
MSHELPITAAQMAGYLRGARQREAARRAALVLRHEQAWSAAKAIAEVLRMRFGATRVVAFGSLVGGPYHERSDIDLAVAGVTPAEFFRASAAAERLAIGFEVDLVALEDAPPWLSATVDAGGQAL